MRWFLLTGFLILYLFGCNKKEPKIRNFISMTVDDIPVKCDRNLHASSPVIPSLYLQGSFPGGSLNIELYNLANNMGEKEINNDNRLYLRTGSATYYAGGDNVGGRVKGSGKITILEINNDYVKGTFSAIPQFTDFTGTLTKKNIINGAFMLKRDK